MLILLEQQYILLVMTKRLNQEREQQLQPIRMEQAILALTNLGYTIVYKDITKIQFIYKGEHIMYYPYSGWATGKTIKDGRGLQNLLNQLKP